jgi:hypothetical protein
MAAAEIEDGGDTNDVAFSPDLIKANASKTTFIAILTAKAAEAVGRPVQSSSHAEEIQVTDDPTCHT